MDIINNKTNLIIAMPKNYIEYIIASYIYNSRPFTTFILNKNENENIFNKYNYNNEIIINNKIIKSYDNLNNVIYIDNSNLCNFFIKNIQLFYLKNNNIFNFRDALYFKINNSLKKFNYITINIDPNTNDLNEFYYIKALLYCLKTFKLKKETLKIIIMNEKKYILNDVFEENNYNQSMFNAFYKKIFNSFKLELNKDIFLSNEMFKKQFNSLDYYEYCEILYSITNYNIITNNKYDISIALSTLKNNKYIKDRKILYPKKLLNIKLENNNIIGI